MSDDYEQCMVSNSRMAARALTRRYDAYLRPFGLSAAQFSLLAAIATTPGETVSRLAERRAFERTTLTRNLDTLEAMGLAASTRHGRGNGRIAEVTPKGRALLAEALPSWRQAQQDLRNELSDAAFDHSLDTLKRLAKV